MISAILCPSGRVEGEVDLAVFRDRLRRNEIMRLLGEDELRNYLAVTYATLHAILCHEENNRT